MAMAAPREWVRVSRLSERLHTQGEEGCGLDMLDEELVQTISSSSSPTMTTLCIRSLLFLLS
jgi:hypothetical protein